MKRRLAMVPALAALLTLLPAIPLVSALDEADRLFTVGERALADRFFPVARRTLERFVAQYPGDSRQPRALLMLGQARLALNDPESALEAITRAQAGLTAPADQQEARLWQGEALLRLKRYAEARALYDEIVRTDAAGPRAPDALYGVARCDLELKHPEAAVAGFRQLLSTWPEHALAAPATLNLARALFDARRPGEALPLLSTFAGKYPGSPLVPEAQFWLGWVKYNSGDPRGGLADLQSFVDANPGHEQAPAARRLIAQGVTKYGTRAQLQQSYTTLMSQTPPTAEAYYEAAGLAARLGQPKDQDAAWRKLRAQFPEDPLTRRLALELAGKAFTAKSYKDASALGAIAAQSDDTAVRAEGLLKVGESELKLAHFPQAAKAFEAIGSLNDVDTDVRYRALAGLGLAHEEQKQWKPALAAYEAVMNNSPDATLRDWARQRVAAVRPHVPAGTPKSEPKRTGSRS